jgi:hypothetical protein
MAMKPDHAIRLADWSAANGYRYAPRWHRFARMVLDPVANEYQCRACGQTYRYGCTGAGPPDACPACEAVKVEPCAYCPRYVKAGDEAGRDGHGYAVCADCADGDGE